MKANKTEIMGLLRDFVGRRPGLEFVNYGDVRAYRAESARIVRDRRDFMELFSFVVWNGGVELDDLVDGFRAFSGGCRWWSGRAGRRWNTRRGSISRRSIVARRARCWRGQCGTTGFGT